MVEGDLLKTLRQIYKDQRNIRIIAPDGVLTGAAYGSKDGGGLFLYVSSSAHQLGHAITSAKIRNSGNGKAAILVGDLSKPLVTITMI